LTDYFSRVTGVSRAAPQQPPADPNVRQVDYFSRAAGIGSPASANSAAANPNAEPDADTWLKRRGQDIQGKQDPRYKDLGTVYEQFTDDLRSPTATAATLGASDPQMGDIVQKSLGDRFIRREKDANDYDIFVTRGPDGQEQRGYLNKPGLDTQDLWRTLYGVGPYVATGGTVAATTKGAGMLVQMGAQALGAGATSVAGDVAQTPMGSEQGVELLKAAFAMAGGAAAPPIAAGLSAIARRFITLPGLFDKAAGKLTPKGQAAAQSAGVNPAELSAEAQKVFAKTYSMTPDAAEAATRAQVEPFGIPATKGQVSKDPHLLTQEEGMRRRLYGENAQDVMRAFDIEQANAVEAAALGTGTGKKSVSEAIAPGRRPATAPQDANPMVLGQSVREGTNAAREAARVAEGEAWEKVGPLTPKPEAFDTLPAALDRRLGADVAIDSVNTPAAAQLAQEMDRFVAGEAPEQVAKILKNNPVRTVDAMRRRLLAISKGAQTPTDKRAAAALYDGFNDWIGEAADNGLLAGDPASAAAMKVARGFTKEVRELFAPTVAGRTSPAGRRLAGVMETADSPEGVINQLLGSSGSRGVDQGTTQALTNLKQALDKYAPADVAKGTWDDVRLAYWVRLVQGRNGEMLGPTAILNNVRAALSNQQSVVRALYAPEEERLIRQFAQALEKISYKPPNASGSGYTAASFIKEGVAKLFEAFGLKSKIGQAALEYSGLGNAYGTAQAKAAVNQSVKPRPSNLAPALSAGGATSGRDRNAR
jgi:hypothetical protein